MSYSPAIELKKSSRAQNSAEPLAFQLFRKSRVRFLYLCLATVLTLNGCAPGKGSSVPQSDAESATSSLATAGDASVSRNPDPTLSTAVDRLLKSPEFSGARWGVAVVSLKDARLIFDHNSDQLFTPASNMKLYTTAVALDLLGPNYRWRTSVYSDAQPDATGTIQGDVTLYGRGAPDLVANNQKENNNSLEELARALAARGVKHINGNIVGDESYFRGDATGEGWQWNDLQWYFGAEASALTVNANSVEISIRSGSEAGTTASVTSNDEDSYITITNNLLSVAHGTTPKIGVKRELSDNNVVVWGEYPVGASGYGVSLSVHRPSLWAATIFKRQLISLGITVSGVPRFRDSRMSEGNRFSPEGKQELAFVTSESLGEIIRTTNKYSVNLYAELLLRTLGRERAAMLSTERALGREKGDDEHGAELIGIWLSRQGASSQRIAIHDGSGLSRLDLVTPLATTQLLLAIRKTNYGEVFADSLPVAGTDGTLAGRLKETEGRLIAKTGALTYANALSGYYTARDGQAYAFSVICNDFVIRPGSVPLIDRLLLTISQYLDQSSNLR